MLQIFLPENTEPVSSPVSSLTGLTHKVAVALHGLCRLWVWGRLSPSFKTSVFDWAQQCS